MRAQGHRQPHRHPRSAPQSAHDLHRLRLLSIEACELLNPDDEAAGAGSGAHYLERASDMLSHPP